MAAIDVAKQVWSILKGYGYADGPIAGVLGNMEAESALIPDRWQNDDIGNLKGGYGLVQWSPATKLLNWAKAKDLDYRTVATQCARIKWEVDTKFDQWVNKSQTFQAWFTSNITPETAAYDFVQWYENPKVINAAPRQTAARKWYNQLHGTSGTPTPTPTPAPTPTQLTVDGLLGAATIKRWQQVMGTTADGIISNPSPLVKAVQTKLNALGCRDWDNKALVVDGIGIYSNLSAATPKSRTQWALQVHLGTTRDGILSKPSPCIQALQRKLNANTF
ncbi:MAG: phage tail tip lysozyme [Propionibacteriaceae bacterium]|nr:phage tail tip lysozyme [Propionibacteriaceae bacterium]